VSDVRFTYIRDPYPMISIKLLAVIGMIAPPRDDPVAMIPNAIALRFLNH
jgi:hypothetical protein